MINNYSNSSDFSITWTGRPLTRSAPISFIRVVSLSDRRVLLSLDMADRDVSC